MNKNIPISILDLISIRQGEEADQAIRQSIQMAQDAELMGYNRFWLAEHHNTPSIASSSTALLINMVADKTQTIRVGSGGIMLPNHSPLSVAESFGTLAAMYPGRIDLGLGRAPGTDGETAAALRRHYPSAHYDFKVNIEELKSYFQTDNDNKKVRAYLAEGRDVPLWILGSSTDSAYLAAEMGLPYAFASHFAPAYLLPASKIYRQNFKPSSSLKEPYFMPCVNVIAAETDAEAELLATTVYQMFLSVITNARAKLPPPLPGFENMLDPQFKMALQQMLYYTFAGGKDNIKKDLNVFIREAQADELMITNYIYDLEKRKLSMRLVQDALSGI